MKAQRGTRYFKERTRLETAIPLKTPFILYLDPSSACNLKCSFCPCSRAHENLWTEEKKESIGIMPFDLYKKIIDDCKEFPDSIKVLRLYKEGEPLVNPNLSEMIAYGRDSGKFDSIDLTTNGTLLNPTLNRKLVEAGLSRINISVEALSGEGYERICGKKIDYGKFIENIRDLYENKGNCHIFIKTMVNNFDDETEQHFFDLFGDICDEIAVEHIANCWPGFENVESNINVYSGADANGQEVIVCPRIFYILVINSDGTVTHCIVDWNHMKTIGNVREQSVYDIWNGEALRQIQLEHLRGNRRKQLLCDQCMEIESAAVDNIDDYREELLRRMGERY
ncbi:radical SAM protein [Desulfitobacterium hafniense]|uniref:Radical SAM protein n=1 Tax=Desulfitobacterium hafniense TaxID=49338 RepID=A0A0W1JJX8_DESHA|nr:radical SAM/SPASM domain-containing protein [Desulfitobacterium hafniense]KTE92012.1 radical SAM protein [Desulfitobacterium hafniense]